MDNRYDAPKLFVLMENNYNLRVVGTCRANRKGFYSEQLLLDKNCDRITFKILVDKRLGMVITRWKDSKKLQVVSTTMAKGVGGVTRRKGRHSTTVKFPKNIITYQQYMDRVYHRDQHKLMGSGFTNVAHF